MMIMMLLVLPDGDSEDNEDDDSRYAKTYKRANNVCVKKKSYLGKDFNNLCKILRCFVEKVSSVAISRFLVAFFSTFWKFMLLFSIFLNYLGLLGLLRCFVANQICHNLRTFSGKIISAQTLLV